MLWMEVYNVCLAFPRHSSLHPFSFSFSLLPRQHVTNFVYPHTSYHASDQHTSNRVNQVQFKSLKLSKTNLDSLFLSVIPSHRWTSEWAYFFSSLSHCTSALSVCSVIQITAVLSYLDTSTTAAIFFLLYSSPLNRWSPFTIIICPGTLSVD